MSLLDLTVALVCVCETSPKPSIVLSFSEGFKVTYDPAKEAPPNSCSDVCIFLPTTCLPRLLQAPAAIPAAVEPPAPELPAEFVAQAPESAPEEPVASAVPFETPGEAAGAPTAPAEATPDTSVVPAPSEAEAPKPAAASLEDIQAKVGVGGAVQARPRGLESIRPGFKS